MKQLSLERGDEKAGFKQKQKHELVLTSNSIWMHTIHKEVSDTKLTHTCCSEPVFSTDWSVMSTALEICLQLNKAIMAFPKM